MELTAAAPPPTPADTSSKTLLPVQAADDKAKLADDSGVKATTPLTFSVG